MRFAHFLRSERKFDGVDALIAQLGSTSTRPHRPRHTHRLTSFLLCGSRFPRCATRENRDANGVSVVGFGRGD